MPSQSKKYKKENLFGIIMWHIKSIEYLSFFLSGLQNIWIGLLDFYSGNSFSSIVMIKSAI